MKPQPRNRTMKQSTVVEIKEDEVDTEVICEETEPNVEGQVFNLLAGILDTTNMQEPELKRIRECRTKILLGTFYN